METKYYRHSATITAIILGIVAFKQFDFDTLKFEKPWLGFAYLIGFAVSLYFVFGYKDKTERQE